MSTLNIPVEIPSIPVTVKESRDPVTSKFGSQESAQSPKLDRDSTIFSAEIEKRPEGSYSEDLQPLMIEEQGTRKVWSKEEEEYLVQIHNSIGNCWSQIANKLSKDHNTVKNHFYAQIRKSVRRINFFILVHFSKKYKELNLSQISKAITLLSEKKREIPNLSGLGIFSDQQINNLKFQLFRYAKFGEEKELTGGEKEKLEKMLEEMNLILGQLKNRGLIGKKNSAFKQARQAKLKRMKECEIMKMHKQKKISEPIKVSAENKQQRIKIEESEVKYNGSNISSNTLQQQEGVNIGVGLYNLNPWNEFFMMYPYNYQCMIESNTFNGWFNTFPYFLSTPQVPMDSSQFLNKSIQSSFSRYQSPPNNLS